MSFPVIRARQELVSVLLAFCIGGYSASAQQTRPAAKGRYQQALPAHVVSIRFSTFGGTCECCPGDELEIRPGQAILLVTFSRECYQQDSRRYRDLRVNADLSGKHWQALQRLVDHDALFALPDRIGCASCYDGLDEFVEVKFSDHSKKSVIFPMGSAPKEISTLSEKLLSLEAKLRDELPVGVTKNSG
jgi:hypothetical protein